ncbi:MAG: glycine--tRNA ligase subunit beta [Rhodospirillaceae bacterium]|jgi:glycyl-tRNA synthetase beta chain|nr:glycine--tRNA ligase subunit beta [Rhodospirillaceae bacterium]MBT3491286.1 glycine--tRNA ligase subunit beta [Rhodospirillaceae bacterium]MBT3782744.1 glycine--tRNA ligase subunit beta [Rhodospirillaceae bacterium]MBT3979589.1 glycine--tRNA ligase subunit beta [Rhodospirillaceae bacterium]MBT4168494.1 glycine--tRNA ligase subunit beta [Rhodospirillaceae bacterium]
MADLLLELFGEEIPARMQARAADDLKRLVTASLKAAELPIEAAEAYVTPRRLILHITGLPLAQPDVREEKRGPKVDAPEKAIEGFLRGNGVTRAQCEERELPKGKFLFAVIERQGRPTAEVLAEFLPTAFADLPWPKSMRWGAGTIRWVRPLHSIIALLDGAVVPLSFAGIDSGDTTKGHRFHAPEAFAVKDFADYQEKLAAAKVLIDAAERRRRIAEGAAQLAQEAGLRLVADDGLVAEIAGLVEWPVPVLGNFDRRFLDVPAEVLVTTMKVNQKYLSLRDGDGKLAPNFITVANLEAQDGGRQIIAGNEYVLTARLADAEFFWTQDKKKTLESRLPALDEMVFHAKLGSLGQKIIRLENLSAALAQFVPGANGETARRAAHLCKADLVSDMVYEFPEVQGVMGRYYALNDGEGEDVAQAIMQHYSPAGPSDDCPTAPTAVCVALADKLDILVGFWAIDEKPTGSRDPFALRRAALGVIRMVLENELRLPLKEAFALALDGYQFEEGDDDSLLDFFADRLKVHLREQGVRHDLVQAVFALGGEDDLVRLIARVNALDSFLGSEDGANLLVAYRRAANILRIEEKKDGVAHDGAVDARLLQQDQETALAQALAQAVEKIDGALSGEDFAGAMAAMAGLRQPVDQFFDAVTVNANDSALRGNRLRLLSQIRGTLHKVADFSEIEG